ncbi:putative NAD(P)H dehydrogenase (quinone) FQR1-like 2 [Iris pallida]|uniref:NAD(P)H dehydrogenase (quinone) n=1 Tax=Iris pallida TaxID=29817 RepID=A0AAX6IHW4_IRIPA|nr:putative NAD(P)H dehydrogenase (quinone) FQR1-like 2 [Iris pallida]
MGKGGGCVPSKKRQPKPPPPVVEAGGNDPSKPLPADDTDADTASASHPQALTLAPPSASSFKIFVVFYSMYGHVELLARRMKEGIDGVDGAEGVLYRVPETLSPEVLEKMKAPWKDEGIPVIESPARLAEADGILFGFPTRYGAMAAQMKAFFDSTGQLWREQSLAGKPAGFFVSTGTQGGGQETTAWTAITQLAHHGMLFVPIGYTFGAGMFNMEDVRGGSPYGAGVFAGDGTREPDEMELALAEHQGKYMASVVKRLVHP